ncbi:beta-1,4-galactosyltransferase 3 [Silurus asotus]|uniref:Beta-1,4-galactosyltransferase n=1 Tax=Silurus asotus TaxID=30991 RepID=A0AAD5FDD7_SILAS|nr:beta-1,4-galactosyltransferase 3 [Silurus asotus]
MPTLTSKWRYLFMLLGVQLIVMALLSREAYQKRVTYFFRIFRKPDVLSGSAGSGHESNHTGADVYANLSHLAQAFNKEDLHYCPKTSPLLSGPIHVSFPSGLTLAQVERKNPLVVRGGRYRPPDCEARHRTAIIIPHRNREQHLKFFLYYIHPFLQRQQLSYGIYHLLRFAPVLHSGVKTATFELIFIFRKRAKSPEAKSGVLGGCGREIVLFLLMNIGFREAMREEDWDCLFFHDVDLIPEDDRNMYTCDRNPKHAAIAMDKFGYKLPYKAYFGGVSALSPLHYLKMNGFPNNYWGWGGEDDDIGIRVSLAGMSISRPSLKIGRYKMIKHKLDEGNGVNPKRFSLLAKTQQTWRADGMNSVEYELVSREYLPLYTNITVDVGMEHSLRPPTPKTQPKERAENRPGR